MKSQCVGPELIMMIPGHAGGSGVTVKTRRGGGPGRGDHLMFQAEWFELEGNDTSGSRIPGSAGTTGIISQSQSRAAAVATIMVDSSLPVASQNLAQRLTNAAE